MKSNRNLVYFFQSLGKKHRLSYRDQQNDQEVWYTHVRPIEFIGGFVALVLVLFVAILSLAAFTPVLSLIPGYAGNKSQEMFMQNMLRLDSLELKIRQLEQYGSNVAVIMDGDIPVVPDSARLVADAQGGAGLSVLGANAMDSALRRQIEESGMYRLQNTVERRPSRAIDLANPVNGVVSRYFSIEGEYYGVGIATSSNQQVSAVAEGVVVLALWTPNYGNIMHIQHSNNLVSVYRHMGESFKKSGQRVMRGEAVGMTGEGASMDTGKGLLEFQLWMDGMPVDPQSFIVF